MCSCGAKQFSAECCLFETRFELVLAELSMIARKIDELSTRLERLSNG